MPPSLPKHAGTPAVFRARLAAFGYDYLIILIYIAFMTLLTWLLLSRFPGLRSDIFMVPSRADLFAFIFLILPVLLYFSMTESSNWQGSWGKRRIGLKVMQLDGNKASFPRSLFRNALKFLPWQLAHTSIFVMNSQPLAATIGLIVVWALVIFYLSFLLFSGSHRTPYDWISAMVVVRS